MSNSSSVRGSTPNSNFVSARMIPARSAMAAPRSYSASDDLTDAGRELVADHRSHPGERDVLVMLSGGCLRRGVKIGAGSRSPSCSPGGNAMPQISPVDRYSFQPEPARYPRTTHSTGRTSARRQIITRPRSSSTTPGSPIRSARQRFGIRADQVVRDDVRRLLEPEPRQTGQDPALVRDRRGQDDIERTDAVAGHEEQSILVEPIQVADLARRQEQRLSPQHRPSPASLRWPAPCVPAAPPRGRRDAR